MEIQQQEGCTKVELQFEESKKPTDTLIRNRRYRKLKELRDEGFFSEDAIKLRHPMLYHTYLQGHYQRSTAQVNSNCTLSQFLQKNLINLEYRNQVAQHMGKTIQDEKEQHSGEDWQLLEELNGEVSMGKKGISNGLGANEKDIVKSWDIVEEEQVELQEQNLIDHAEELFLTGKVDKAFVDYSQIDCNSAYDGSEGEEDYRRVEQKYLVGSGDQQEDQRINMEHYTGIQDF